MPDADLILALKMAKTKKMFFAFIPKGPEGKLIVSKKKIPPKEIADAKKEIGGGSPITGKCMGAFDSMVFEVAKAPPATLAAAIKKVAKRDTGLTIIADFQVAGDADADEAETEEGGGAAPPPPPSAPAGAAAGAACAAGNAAAGASANAAAAGDMNLAPWQAARDNAIKDLKALAAKVAATKHGTAAGVLKEINFIITKLPAKPAAQEVDKLVAFIRQDDTISARGGSSVPLPQARDSQAVAGGTRSDEEQITGCNRSTPTSGFVVKSWPRSVLRPRLTDSGIRVGVLGTAHGSSTPTRFQAKSCWELP